MPVLSTSRSDEPCPAPASPAVSQQLGVPNHTNVFVADGDGGLHLFWVGAPGFC
jgi:hypothetical protein